MSNKQSWSSLKTSRAKLSLQTFKTTMKVALAFALFGFFIPSSSEAAVAYKNHSCNNISTNFWPPYGIDISKPTGTQTGDLLIATISSATTISSNTAPTGWTFMSKRGTNMITYYKWAGSSEPANYGFNPNNQFSPNTYTGSITSFSGVNNAFPFTNNGRSSFTASTNTNISLMTDIFIAPFLYTTGNAIYSANYTNKFDSVATFSPSMNKRCNVHQGQISQAIAVEPISSNTIPARTVKFNSASASLTMNEETVFLIGDYAPVPPAPTAPSPSKEWDGAPTTSTPTLHWNSVQGATSYQIEVRNDKTNQPVASANLGSSATAWTTTSLPTGTYKWTVQATNSGGSAKQGFAVIKVGFNEAPIERKDTNFSGTPNEVMINAMEQTDPVLKALIYEYVDNDPNANKWDNGLAETDIGEAVLYYFQMMHPKLWANGYATRTQQAKADAQNAYINYNPEGKSTGDDIIRTWKARNGNTLGSGSSALALWIYFSDDADLIAEVARNIIEEGRFNYIHDKISDHIKGGVTVLQCVNMIAQIFEYGATNAVHVTYKAYSGMKDAYTIINSAGEEEVILGALVNHYASERFNVLYGAANTIQSNVEQAKKCGAFFGSISGSLS